MGERVGAKLHAAEGRIHWHHHALERFLERGISRAEVVTAVFKGEVIEVYPKRHPYPGCLISYFGMEPLHVVAAVDPAVRIRHIITAYRPDLTHFESNLTTRRKKS